MYVSYKEVSLFRGVFPYMFTISEGEEYRSLFEGLR